MDLALWMGHSGVISVNVQALYSTALNTRSSLLIASRKLTPCCKEVALSVDVHGGALSVDHGQYHRRRVVCGLWTVPCPLSPQRCAPHTPLEKPSPQGSVATSTARPLASIVPFIAWGGPCRTSRSRDVVCGEGGQRLCAAVRRAHPSQHPPLKGRSARDPRSSHHITLSASLHSNVLEAPVAVMDRS